MKLRDKYLNYLFNHISCSVLPEPGKIVIDGRVNDVWNHPHVIIFREFIINNYKPRHDIVLLVPCTPRKPYSITHFRRILYHNLKKHGLWDKIEIISISDLMGLVPRDLEELYPVANYEYSPQLMKKYGHEKDLIELLSIEFSLLHGEQVYAWLPRSYIPFVEEASKRAKLNIIIHPYTRLPYQLAARIPLLLKSIIS